MYKVMIVDDEILVRKTIGENIDWASLGYELVVDCQNGQEAIEFLENNSVDVVLTDINMPFVDGIELSRYICNNCSHTKVIIFSGYNDFSYAKKAIQYKVTEYLLKPVTPKELIAALDNVKTVLDKTKTEEDKAEQLHSAFIEYTKHESLIISKEVLHLMKGTQDTELSIKNLKRYGVSMEGKAFRVVNISVDLYAEGPNFDSVDRKESELMTFVIENISSEIVEQENCGIVCRDGNRSVCLLLCSNIPGGFGQKTEQICNSIKKYTYEAMKLSLSIVVGKSVSSLQELPQSYQTVEQLKAYTYVQGADVYIDYNVIQGKMLNSIDIEKYVRELNPCLKRTEEEPCKNLIESMQQELSSVYIGKSKAIAYLVQIITEASRIVVETRGNQNSCDDDEREECISQIYYSYTLQEGIEYVLAYIGKMRNALEEMQQSSGVKLATSALHYIQEHYNESTLGLNEVCTYLNISVSHFSTIYKEEMGETFMETLTRTRMEESKKLLVETNLKNYEIAERVGFSDPHYFNIAFKKATGVTPKRYGKEKKLNG